MKALILVSLALIVLSCHKTMLEPSVDQSTNKASSNGVELVDFCTLLNTAKDFDQRVVTTKAILIAGFESAFLYDPRCVSNDKLVWFEIRNDTVNKQLEPFLLPELPEFRTAGVNRVQGIFRGTFRTKTNEGFGHLNSSNFKFEIDEVKDLEPVPKDMPYPW